MKFRELGTPILLVSDAPELLGGLSRIARDLATLLCTMPQFRVGFLGRGGMGKRKFPWVQYHFPETAQWGEDYLAQAWIDFADGEPGIIFSLWDLSRQLYFGQPQILAQNRPDLARFLGPGRDFQKWGYVPIDSTGPNEYGLPTEMAATAAGYDRLLAASEWGRRVLHISGRQDADWVPHGIWMDKFKPSGKLLTQQITVGCNMANQSRKDWPVAFETAMLLKQAYGNKFKFWAHTDTLIRYWNLYALAADYGVQDCIEVSIDQTDDQLAARYAACDCTILPSAGEGFGFPIVESMACGTACVVTDYAAGQELVDADCRVPPIAYRLDTQHNVRRAVLSAYGFAHRAQDQVEKKRNDWTGRTEEMQARVEHLSWQKLQHVWKRWLLKGIGHGG